MMLKAVAEVAQAQAVWKYIENVSAETLGLTVADHKAGIAQALARFIRAAHAVAFELVPRLIAYGEEITTKSEVRTRL